MSIDRKPARAWEQARRVAEFTGPTVWMHADLHPATCSCTTGTSRPSSTGVGLPWATRPWTASLPWTLLSPQTRPTFRARVDVEGDTWRRGRAWALSIALVALPYYARTSTQITAWAGPEGLGTAPAPP